jgi:hypothetical protein
MECTPESSHYYTLCTLCLKPLLCLGVQPAADGRLAMVGHLAGAVPVGGRGAVGGRALAPPHRVPRHPPPHPPRLLLPHPPAPPRHLYHGMGQIRNDDLFIYFFMIFIFYGQSSLAELQIYTQIFSP